MVQNLDYLPFGENNSTDSHISTHEFTGDERDSETSLDHTQFRQYTSQLARWITPDPAGLAAVDPLYPQSWNRYSYVINDPIDLVDPLGLATCVTTVDAQGNPVMRCTVDVSGGGNDGGGARGQQCLDITLDGILVGNTCDGSGGHEPRRSGGASGSRTLDDRANALAKALNNTGAQSLANPCTIATFYAASALGGTGAAAGMNAGELAATTKGVASTYWPQALNQAFNWLYRQGLRGGPVAYFILSTLPKNYNKTKAAVQSGCNAMQ